jgi:glycosyltransferase involved in cell wall biosynthesis
MKPIRITMLIASLDLTGTPRMMMDIIDNINWRKFAVNIAYKPEYVKSELDLLKDLDKLGVKIIPLRGKRLFDPRGVFDLYKHLKRDSVQIVHCWDALGIAARVLKLFLKFGIVQSYCNTIVSKGSSLYYIINKITSLFTDGIIFCSEGVYNSFKRKKTIFLRGKLTELIYNCINIEAINNKTYDITKVKKKLDLSKDNFILTNIGYFNEQKGQSYLLDSLKIIVNNIPQVKLILIGWGPLEKNLRVKAKELELENNVIFAGKCQRDTVSEILSITDVFVLSSLWEGFGLVIGEAMAMAKPVVCTRTDGSELLVEHNKTGIIVPPKNPRDLAKAVIHLVGSPERRLSMGFLGRKRVSTLFPPDKFIRQHEAFYKKILQS